MCGLGNFSPKKKKADGHLARKQGDRRHGQWR